MDFHVAFENLEKKFTSGNSIPVSRSVITREEWEAIKWELELLEEANSTLRAKSHIRDLVDADVGILPLDEEKMKYVAELVEGVDISDNSERN